MNGKRLIGLYPGTFDPVTLGHLDIVKRAVKLVDHLVIGVAINASKNPVFTLAERVAMLKAEAGKLAAGHATIEVTPFDTLLVKFAAEVGASMIVRGSIRSFSHLVASLSGPMRCSPPFQTRIIEMIRKTKPARRTRPPPVQLLVKKPMKVKR